MYIESQKDELSFADLIRAAEEKTCESKSFPYKYHVMSKMQYNILATKIKFFMIAIQFVTIWNQTMHYKICV